jgi:hypothetical protein
MAKAKLLLLNVDDMVDGFFEDAILYGLKFNEGAVYVAWFLKNELNIKFVRDKSFFKRTEDGFDLYHYLDQKKDMQHLLYTNNKYGKYLIRELKGFHYFWLVKGSTNAYIYMSMVMQKLQALNSNIELVQLDTDKIKEKAIFIL